MINRRDKDIAGCICLALVLIWLVDHMSAQMTNNCDYVRVANSMYITPEGWKANAECMPFSTSSAFDYKQLAPRSTMALFAAPAVILEIFRGSFCFHSNTLFLELSTIYWIGTLFSVFRKQKKVLLTELVALAVFYFLYGYYLKSLYQEAAVLTLIPWLACFWKNMECPSGRYGFLATSALVIFSKIQMIFVLPIFLMVIFSSTPFTKKNFAFLSLSVVLLTGMAGYGLYKEHKTAGKVANAYNRLFNGIGWSVQEAKDWDATNYIDRHLYFEKNKQELQLLSTEYEPVKKLILMGTPYAPYGYELLSSPADDHDNALHQELSEALEFANFIRQFHKIPNLLPTYLANIYSITAISDYSLEYIRNKNQSRITSWLDGLSGFIYKNNGFVYLLTAVFCAAMAKKRGQHLVIIYLFLGAPIFVVVGDGYFEFEKHMMPYFFISFALLITYFELNSRKPNDPVGKR